MADDVETDLWQGGYSSKAMLGTWVAVGLLTILGLIAGIMLPQINAAPLGWPILIGVLVLAWVIAGLRFVYRRLSIKYRLTTLRFFFEQGLFSRMVDRVEVINIDDVTVRQGFFERMMNVGSVTVISSDRTTPEITMVGIEQPRHVADLVDKQRRDLRNRRGVRVEQI